MESYTFKAQESTVNVLEVELIELIPIIVESSAFGALESTVDVLKAPLMESTSTLYKLVQSTFLELR
jgi:hypothetical protein